MRIRIRRTGGYAGVSEELAAVDTSTLGPARAEQIRRLLEEIGFFDLPARVAGGEGADYFRIELAVENDTRRHTVTFLDDGTPETAPLRGFVEAMQKIR